MPRFARFSSVLSRSGITFSNGGSTVLSTPFQYCSAFSDVGHNSGKWYFEVTLDVYSGSDIVNVGAITFEHDFDTVPGVDTGADGCAYSCQAGGIETTRRQGTTDTTDVITVAQGDVIGVAIDLDAGEIYFSVNGVWMDSSNPATATNPRYSGGDLLTETWYAAAGSSSSAPQYTINCGDKPFSYSVPTGFNEGWYIDETAFWFVDDGESTDQLRCKVVEEGRRINLIVGNSGSSGAGALKSPSVIDDHYAGGKWYWEVALLAGTFAQVGFCNASHVLSGSPDTSANAWVVSQNGGAFFCGGTSSGSITFGVGDTIGFAVDMTSGDVDVYRNGSLTLTGICTLSGYLYPLAYGSTDGGGTQLRAAWKTADFAYTPPAGYVGLGDFDPQFTWDSTEKGSGVTLHRSDVLAENTTDNHNVFATSGVVSAGKWYWEVVCTSGIEDVRIGVAEASFFHTTGIGASSESYAVLTLNGNKQENGLSASAYCAGGNINVHEVVGVALDMDNGRIFFSVDGTWCASGDPAAGTNAAFTGITTPMVPAVSGAEDVASGNSWAKLVSHPAFMVYEPPSGFKHLDEYVPPIAGDADVDLDIEIDATGRVTVHGDGDPDIGITIEATGDVHTRRGDGEVDLDVEIDGTGRVTVHGDGDVDIDLLLLGVGNTARTGFGNPDITIELDATGTLTPAIRGDGDVDLAIEIDGTGFSARPFDADITLPLLQQQGTIIQGTVAAGAFPLPVFELEGSLGPRTDITLPMLQLEASVASGEAARGAFELPVFTLDATVEPPATISADITLPRLSLVGTLARGVGATADITLPRLSLEGSALVGAVLDGDVDLPALTLQAQASPPALLAADITLPGFLLRARGYPALPGLIERAYSLNTESLGVVPYTAFPYHAIGRIGSSLYGFTSAGLTLLEGADDEGADIDASFTFGITDFSDASGIDGELKKRVTDAYIGYRGNGDLLLTLTLDGETLTRTYRMTRRSQDTGLRQRRAKLNRGDKSRYWQLEVANVNGGDFDIDSIGLLVRNITSKVR